MSKIYVLKYLIMSLFCPLWGQQNKNASINIQNYLLVLVSNLLFSVLVVSPVCLASLDLLVRTASLDLLGRQVEMVVMVVTVTKAARERLDPRDLQELLVSMDKMAPKENLDFRALPVKRGSAERVG